MHSDRALYHSTWFDICLLALAQTTQLQERFEGDMGRERQAKLLYSHSLEIVSSDVLLNMASHPYDIKDQYD